MVDVSSLVVLQMGKLARLKNSFQPLSECVEPKNLTVHNFNYEIYRRSYLKIICNNDSETQLYRFSELFQSHTHTGYEQPWPLFLSPSKEYYFYTC